MEPLQKLFRCQPVIYRVLKNLDLESINNLAEACPEIRAFLESTYFLQRQLDTYQLRQPYAVRLEIKGNIVDCQMFKSDEECLIETFADGQYSLRILAIDNDMKAIEAEWASAYPTEAVIVSRNWIFRLKHEENDSRLCEVLRRRRSTGHEKTLGRAFWFVFHHDGTFVGYTEPLDTRDVAHLIQSVALVPTGPAPALGQSLRWSMDPTCFLVFTNGNGGQFTRKKIWLIGTKLLIVDDQRIACFRIEKERLEACWELCRRPREELHAIRTITGYSDTQNVVLYIDDEEGVLKYRILNLEAGFFFHKAKTVHLPGRGRIFDVINFTGKLKILVWQQNITHNSMVLYDIDSGKYIRFLLGSTPWFDFTFPEAPTGFVSVGNVIIENRIKHGLLPTHLLDGEKDIRLRDLVFPSSLPTFDYPRDFDLFSNVLYMGDHCFIKLDNNVISILNYDRRCKPLNFFNRVQQFIKKFREYKEKEYLYSERELAVFSTPSWCGWSYQAYVDGILMVVLVMNSNGPL